MTLAPGTRLGPYEIVGPVGAGGMGEVYRARDTRLDRVVAVKILPAHLAAAADLRARFHREARIISALSHPHICALYDVGQHDGVDYAVMEYLEGETLAQRLERGAMPLEQLLGIAIQTADALARAHREGITHRDLKPGNIMLTNGGAKLLDFGLAKSEAPLAGAAPAVTVTAPVTAAGTIVGTYPYMSPEQIQGGATDARSDIFAFGAILYEMATGRRAFGGSSPISILSAVLEKEPEPIATLRPITPPLLERLTTTCLAKQADRRWQSAYDIKLELENIRDAAGHAPPRGSRRRELAGWATAAIIALVALVAAAVWPGSTPAPEGAARSNRSSLLPPQGLSFSPRDNVISPDGARMAFVSFDPADGQTALWIRSLDGRFGQQQLVGTAGAMYPFWAPDNVRIGFFADRQLKIVNTTTGEIKNVSAAPVGRGGTWNSDGTILFAPSIDGPLFRVTDRGGRPEAVTGIDPESGKAHRWPVFLSDGRQFLFAEEWGIATEARPTGLYAGSLASAESKLISAEITGGVAVAAGHVLYVEDASLMARPFDEQRLAFTGPAVRLIDQELKPDHSFGHPNFSVSGNGALLYQSLRDSASELIRYTRDGREAERLPVPPASTIDLAPDGRYLAMTSEESNGQRYVLVHDFRRGVTRRLTSGGREGYPAWSHDGSLIAYLAEEGGASRLYEVPAAGGSPTELLRGPRATATAYSPPDGRTLVYMTFARGAPDIRFLDRHDGSTREFGRGAEAQYSPDGRLLAFARVADVYVQRLEEGSPPLQISGGGGAQPRWSRDGKRLYYFSPKRQMMEVPVEISGGEVSAGTARPVFQTRVVAPSFSLFQYVVTSDGFIVNSLRPDAPLTIISGWPALLRR